MPKGLKDILRLSFFPRTITEWNKLGKEINCCQSISLSTLKANSFRLSFTGTFNYHLAF